MLRKVIYLYIILCISKFPPYLCKASEQLEYWNVKSSVRLLSTAPIGAGDFFLVDCDSNFNNCPFRMISVYQEKFNFRILNRKYFKTLKTYCINCYSLETIF